MTQDDKIREIIQTRGLSTNASAAVWEAVRSERKRCIEIIESAKCGCKDTGCYDFPCFEAEAVKTIREGK